MTQRHSGYLVVLTEDLREDDAEPVLEAIRLLRGVAGVVPVESEFHAQRIADYRVRSELLEKVRAALWQESEEQ